MRRIFRVVFSLLCMVCVLRLREAAVGGRCEEGGEASAGQSVAGGAGADAGVLRFASAVVGSGVASI